MELFTNTEFFDAEGESVEEESQLSVLIGVDDTFNIDGFPVHTGQFLPKSAPNLDGLSETRMQRVLENAPEIETENLFEKNTESFRCLTQILISRSSLMRHILYHFPVLVDPGIDEAFTYIEPEQTFDDIGTGKYRQLCKDMNIAPIARVIRSLNTDTLNLKYYGLSDKQFKAISSCIMLNTHIKTLIIADNWISPEAALWLCEMMRENNSINVLNLHECRLGIKGMTNCAEGFSLNQSVREIDLSCNDLGNEGMEILVGALKGNYNVDKLNLGHNNLGESGAKPLGDLLREHTNIDFLDLSWNDLYEGKALNYLLSGIAEADSLEYLNLQWNGISTPEHMAPLAKYIKETKKLQHLDLSFNRLMGKMIHMLTNALKDNKSLKSINLGFNLITPTDALKLISILHPDHPLEYMDLQNVYVNKNFVPLWKKLTDMGKSVRIEGILENYTIEGPDKRKVVFDRCRYLAQKPKKKKLKKDFGSDFIMSLPDEIVDNATLKKLVKKSKINLDNDLIDFLGETFSRKKKKIELKLMRDAYLELYPDTQPLAPPKTPKSDKKNRRRTRKFTHAVESTVRPSTEEKAIGTDSLVMSPLENASSVVTSKMVSGTNALIRLSRIQQEMLEEPTETENVVTTIDLDVLSEKEARKSIVLKSIVSLNMSRVSMIPQPKNKSGVRMMVPTKSDDEAEDRKDLMPRKKSIMFKEPDDEDNKDE